MMIRTLFDFVTKHYFSVKYPVSVYLFHSKLVTRYRKRSERLFDHRRPIYITKRFGMIKLQISKKKWSLQIR